MVLKNSLRIFLLFSFVFTLFANAHGNLSIRIKEKTTQIKSNPENANLYFDRGFLYQQHEEYDKAVLDYLKAEKLGYNANILNFRKAESYFKWNKLDLALNASSKYLENDQNDVKIYKLHAQILYQLKKFEVAINHFTIFLTNVSDPRPDDYIELSSMIVDTRWDYHKGIEIIDVGLNRLGNIVSLQLQKLKYFKASNQFEKAIEQYNQFILSTQRKEFWYYKKANYLFENNQIMSSKIALQQSRMAISILKVRIKNTQAIKTLIKNINKLEKQLNHE